jgi:hypothetical protein
MALEILRVAKTSSEKDERRERREPRGPLRKAQRISGKNKESERTTAFGFRLVFD